MSNSPVTQDQLTLWNKIHPGVPFPGFIPQSNTQGGTQTQQSTNQSGQTGTQTQPQQQSQTSTQQNGNQQGGLYGALISALAQRSLQPSQDYQNQQNLANQYNQALTGSRLAEAGALAGNAATPVDQSFGEGRANIIGNRYAQEQAALGSGFQGASTLLGAANTQQGLQQSGLGSAAGLAQPVSQFGMLTNPITGVPLNTGVFQNAVQQAVQLVQNGTPANDPSVTSLLSSFGFVGPLAFQNAMSAMSGGQGSVWNPAAQSAAAGQNIAGATNFQQQAVALDTGLKNMRTVAPLITQAASQVGINPTDASMYNAPINTYISQIQNSGGFANFQAMINDVQRYSSQIISSGADLTPTGVTAATALMSPQNLSISQIQSYLGTLDQLGTNQLAILQQQAQASGGSSAGYYGNPANVTSGYTAPQSNALGGNITSPGGQFAAGAGLGVLGSFENIGSTVLSFLAGLKL